MRTFTIFLVALSLSLSASAQDLLVKRNGEQMKVKVLKITKKKVEFVRHGTELPVYTLPISDIEYIEYPMGDRDTFGRNVESKTVVEKRPPMWHGAVPTPEGVVAVEYKPQSSPEQTPEEQTPKRWHGSVPTPDGAVVVEYKPQSSTEQTPKRWHGAYTGPAVDKVVVTKPAEEETYSIGDIYDKNGVKGVVVMLTDGGRHGLVMSLDEACLAWSNLPRKQQKAVGASDRHDGAKNMEAVAKYIAENNLSWKQFPAFEWCRAKGDGWYLPSINELWTTGTMFLGGSRTASNRKYRKLFNDNVEGAGGTPLSGVMIYHSSTEDKDARYSLYSHMNSEAPYIQSGYKADDLFVRAVHKF